MIAHCSSAVMRQGAPERGASLKRSSTEPPQPAFASQRPRHWLTVLRQTPNCCDVAVMLTPAAKSKIIRARKTALCAIERARTKPSRSAFSAADKTRTVAAMPMVILQNESIAIENQSKTALKTKFLRVNNSTKVISA